MTAPQPRRRLEKEEVDKKVIRDAKPEKGEHLETAKKIDQQLTGAVGALQHAVSAAWKQGTQPSIIVREGIAGALIPKLLDTNRLEWPKDARNREGALSRSGEVGGAIAKAVANPKKLSLDVV